MLTYIQESIFCKNLFARRFKLHLETVHRVHVQDFYTLLCKYCCLNAASVCKSTFVQSCLITCKSKLILELLLRMNYRDVLHVFSWHLKWNLLFRNLHRESFFQAERLTV